MSSLTCFKVAQLCYTEIMPSDWLKGVKWLGTSNQRALINCCIVKLCLNLFMTMAPGLCRLKLIKKLQYSEMEHNDLMLQVM